MAYGYELPLDHPGMRADLAAISAQPLPPRRRRGRRHRAEEVPVPPAYLFARIALTPLVDPVLPGRCPVTLGRLVALRRGPSCRVEFSVGQFVQGSREHRSTIHRHLQYLQDYGYLTILYAHCSSGRAGSPRHPPVIGCYLTAKALAPAPEPTEAPDADRNDNGTSASKGEPIRQSVARMRSSNPITKGSWLIAPAVDIPGPSRRPQTAAEWVKYARKARIAEQQRLKREKRRH